MADQPKKKRVTDIRRNDERKNGKAFKRTDRSRNKSTRLTELQKALFGGGAMKRVERPAPVKKDPEPAKTAEVDR